MTQTMDYTASIKTKRCKNTGITEEIIRELHTRPGRRIMAVVELRVDDAHNKHDAPNHVDLTIESIEPAMEDFFDEHLRELSATKYQNRAIADGEPTLDYDDQGDTGRPLTAVVADGQAHLADEELEDDDQDDAAAAADPDDPAYEPHPYLEGPDGDSGCITCDQPADSAIHTTADEPVPA